MGIQTQAVAGPFRVTYFGPGAENSAGSSATNPQAATLGIIGNRGIRLIRRFEGEDYGGDLLGDSTIETVYLGGQCFLEFELEEANLQNCLAIQNPFSAGNMGNPTTALDNQIGVPGTFMTAKAGGITLNPLYTSTGNVHTTAGNQVTPVLWFGLVTLAAGFDMERLFSARRRVIPVRFRCYPYSDGGSPAKYIWFKKEAIDSTYRIV